MSEAALRHGPQLSELPPQKQGVPPPPGSVQACSSPSAACAERGAARPEPAAVDCAEAVVGSITSARLAVAAAVVRKCLSVMGFSLSDGWRRPWCCGRVGRPVAGIATEVCERPGGQPRAISARARGRAASLSRATSEYVRG